MRKTYIPHFSGEVRIWKNTCHALSTQCLLPDGGKENLFYSRGLFLGMGLDAMGKAQGPRRVQDAFPCTSSFPPSFFQWWWTLSWAKTPSCVQQLEHELVFVMTHVNTQGWKLGCSHTWLVSGLLTPAKGSKLPSGAVWDRKEMMSISATLIPCHTLTGSLVSSSMFSHCFYCSWCQGCSHRWWPSPPHITSGSGSAPCTTVGLWGITMREPSCPEGPAPLPQTACSAGRKADLCALGCHPPPHLLTLWRW